MEENWFIFKEDHHLGPFSASTLLDMLEDQEVSENVLVWKEGFDAWLPLKDCPEFQLYDDDEEDVGPPPLPPLPFEEEEFDIPRSASNVDELISEAHGLRPEDLQPEVDRETSERFWSEVDEDEPRIAKAERSIDPLEYNKVEIQQAEIGRDEFHDQHEIDEALEEHHEAIDRLEEDDQGPPPLPPLPPIEDEFTEDEIVEQALTKELFEEPEVFEDEEEEQEYLFEHTDVYEDEVQSGWQGEVEDVYEEESVDHHALDQVEAEQAQREKRADLLIHSAWALACVGFILISLYFIFGIEQRKEQFTGLTKSDFSRLTAVSKKATSGSLEGINFDLAVGTDLQSIWAASNRIGPAGLFLSLKSVDDNILGIGPVLVNSSSELIEGVSVFDKFEIVEGDRVSPGLYNVHMKVYDTSLKHRFFHFLKGVPILGKLGFVNSFKGVADFNKQILMFDGSLSEFKTKLAEFKKKNQEYRARPIRQRIEAYSTLTNLSKKIFELYESTQGQLKLGKDITAFEKVYGTQVSPLLQGIILDNIKKQRRIKNQNPTEEEQYDRLVMYGRKVGEFAADIVTDHRGLKKLSSKRKKALLSKYESTLKKIESEGEKLINESNHLLRSL